MNETHDIILGMSHNYFSGRMVTPEVLGEFIERMKLAFPDKDLDEDFLFKKLESIHNIIIEGVTKTLEDHIDHEVWFNPSTNQPLNREFEWHFWDHYKKYMSTKKHWPYKIIEELDNTSSEILSRIEDPMRTGIWDRRGMVMGNVQSGKTANYTALITKAADAGYKLIVVFAGVHNSLRSQTQYRLNEEFLGYDLDQIQRITGREKRIGVRRLFDNHAVVSTLTSSNEGGDFKKDVVTRAGIMPSTTGDPIILIIKKHVSILKNVMDWVTGVIGKTDSTGKRVIDDIPVLVIDDECDYASVNTKKPELDESGNIIEEWDPAKTNMRIRQLLSVFSKSIYIGYTATPYANIFIHKDNVHPTYGEDLFPRSFIITLSQPSNYIGPDKIFGLDAYEEQDIEELEPLPLVRTIDDSDEFIPGTHKKELNVDMLPDSLVQAIKCFILACAARMQRAQGIPHNSMLIHVTRFTRVQNQIFLLIKKELQTLVSRIMSKSDSLNDFRRIWEDDFINTSKKMKTLDFSDAMVHTWVEIAPFLYEAVRKINVKQINGEAKDTLDYREADLNTYNKQQEGAQVPWAKRGINVIAVGGDKLSRGLTLDGLTVSYYLRASRMYDTLMQMGRWFGYRDGYNDLCRIFTTQDLSDWYRYIAGATIELRNEIDYMSAINSTPEKFGLKVRSHPGRLVVTSAGKSRYADRISLSYNHRISETIVFDPRYSEANRSALETMLKQIGRNCDDLPCERKSTKYYWTGVEPDIILNFLRSYITQNMAKKIVDPSRIAEYIQKQNNNQELIKWSVAIISKPKSRHFVNITGFDIGCVYRNANRSESDRISIGRLVDPQDEFLDFSSVELDRARDFDRIDRGRIVGENERPSGIAVRHVRPVERGLLIIYLPYSDGDLKYGMTGQEVVGFAVSFPNSENAVPVEYLVNPVHMEE